MAAANDRASTRSRILRLLGTHPPNLALPASLTQWQRISPKNTGELLGSYGTYFGVPASESTRAASLTPNRSA